MLRAHIVYLECSDSPSTDLWWINSWLTEQGWNLFNRLGACEADIHQFRHTYTYRPTNEQTAFQKPLFLIRGLKVCKFVKNLRSVSFAITVRSRNTLRVWKAKRWKVWGVLVIEENCSLRFEYTNWFEFICYPIFYICNLNSWHFLPRRYHFLLSVRNPQTFRVCSGHVFYVEMAISPLSHGGYYMYQLF
jgi:hypothetical protein